MAVYKVYEWNTALTLSESDFLDTPNTDPASTFYAGSVKAEPYLLPNTIRLSWTLPTHPNFDRIVVYRRTDQFQTDPLSPYGVQIYSGTATTIYDYWQDYSQVPANNDLNRNIAEDDITRVATNYPLRSGKILLNPDKIYYYTVFAADTGNNFYYSPTTMVTAIPLQSTGWADRLWDAMPPIYQQSDIGGDTDPLGNNWGYSRRLLLLISFAIEWLYAKTKGLSGFYNVLEIEPYLLPYIAGVLGWSLDTTSSISVQRNAILNALNIYQWAGTSKGLDSLVKYYSGFPASSGIIEGATTLMQTPLFTQGQIYYTDRVAPDFTSLDVSKIGKVDDPLFYDYDFSSDNKNSSNSFTAYVNPTYTLSADQVSTLQSKLDRELAKFVPLGVNYSISIYNN